MIPDTTTDPRLGLGLEHGVNRLAAHNPLWAGAFAAEAARIREGLAAAGLGERVLGLEHYGSSAVAGLMAKPILDLQIGVEDIADAVAFVPAMVGLGYDDAGDQGIPQHRIFGLAQPRRVLAHVAVFESEAWFETLRFRDRLRVDPRARAAYQTLKLDLARTTANRAEYTAAKTAFVKAMSA
jgi:GrpB-like predicted nucleotidyltransferase (UPF0157 family)